MSEQAGTPEQFARLFGGASKPDHKAVVNAIHPDDAGLTADQEKAAREFDLPPAIASRLVGDTWTEVERDARTLSDAMKDQAEAEEPEHVRLARQAIEAAKRNPNVAELAALGRTKRSHAAINALLHDEGGESE